MAVKTIITDDLTGQTLPDDTKPTKVKFDGKDFEVYLSDDSKETLAALFSGEAPILATVKPARSARGSRASTNKNTYGYETKDVRAWAIANNIKNVKKNGETSPVGDRGIIAQNVFDEYHAAVQAGKV